MLTLDKVYKASHVLKEVIRETDLIKAPKINKEAEVYLKTENLQVTGSFKVRGAYFKISQLSDGEGKGRYRLLRRKPRAGRCSRGFQSRYQVAHLPARRRAYL